jgi:hypothetical protein
MLALFSLAWAEANRQGSEPPPSMPARELVRKTVANEISGGHARVSYMFRDQKKTPSGSQTRLIVETRQGTAGLTVAINGKPLDSEQKKKENARVQRFVDDPDELKKKQKDEKEDAERTTRIMKALPDAFLYEYDGTENGTPGIGGANHELVRLKFHPDPHYSPPSRTEQVLTGMQGVLLIDAKEYRIAEIDGTLFQDVGFGWGILGRLDRGGRFLVQQAEVGQDHWEVSHMKLNFTGKILLVKSLNIQSDETFSHFEQVASDLTFQQGLELLRRREAEQNTASSASAGGNGPGTSQ